MVCNTNISPMIEKAIISQQKACKSFSIILPQDVYIHNSGPGGVVSRYFDSDSILSIQDTVIPTYGLGMISDYMDTLYHRSAYIKIGVSEYAKCKPMQRSSLQR